MKSKFSKESHPGNHPVRVLSNNIIFHFENIKPTILKLLSEAILRKKIEPGICYTIDKEPLKTPFASCDTKNIHLTENYIAFIWAISYSLFIINESRLKESKTSENGTSDLIFNTELLERCKKLFLWAISLKKGYSHWDLDLPNPEENNIEIEQSYAEKINGIFQDIIVYNLFHEVGHLLNNHCEVISGIINKNYLELTESEIALYKQIETEADNFAFECIVEQFDTEKTKFYKGIAITIAHCSSLFIIDNSYSIEQNYHPDLDNRILNSITRLNLNEETYEDYIWQFGALCCKIFFDIHDIKTDTSPSETSKMLFFRYLRLFDEIKNIQK
jgi:hypothetical protein